MRHERGHAPAVEAAIIIPGLILLVGVIVVLAQIALAQQQLHAVASTAARSAAMERSPAAAELRATQAAEHALGEYGLVCLERGMAVLAADVAAPPGREASVGVRLSCRMSLGEVALPLLPGAVTITAASDSPVDRYRSR